MKKIFYILILLFIQPLAGLGQNDTIINKENTFKNQIDLDVYFLGIETSYKRRVSDKLFIGIGLRGLMYRPAINSELEIDETFAEIISIRPFLDFRFNNNFHIETGVPYSMAYSSSGNDFGHLIGFEVGAFLKVWKLEMGLRPSILFYKNGKKFETGVFTTSLLIIKIPLGRW
jgi:hypothetical protein